MSKQDKEELVRMFVKVPKSKKEMIQKVVEKTSYNTASDLIRAGIDKELNIQMYKDNLEVILQEISKCIDYKLDGFIKSQRKLYANNVRISAINTYAMGEVLKRLYKIEQKIYPKSSIGMIEDILLRCVNNSCSNSCCNCMEGNMVQIDLYGHIYHCKNQGKQSYVGNIFKDDIDIIKKDVKDFKLSFDKTECKECQYGYICRGGCRTKIYAKQKSLYGKGTRCQEMYKLIEMIIKDKEDGKLDQLLFQIQLSYEFNSMNGFLKWV